MTEQGNYLELILLERDIDNNVNASPAFRIFHKEKIKNFYSKNKMRLQVAKKTLNEMLEEHVKKDEKGEYMKILNEDASFESYVFHTKADEEEYKIKYDAFCSRNIDIHY